MKAKLYDLMNWAQIEGIVYSEEDKPGTILGPHTVGSSTLFQAFFPDAKKVTLILEDKNKRVPMDVADEEGFFAATAAGKKAGPYSYEVITKEGERENRFEWIPFEKLEEKYFYPKFLKKDIFNLPENFTIRTEME